MFAMYPVRVALSSVPRERRARSKQQLNSKLSQDREHYKMTTSPAMTKCYCYGEGGTNGVRTDTSAHLPSTHNIDIEDTVARPPQWLGAWL